MAQINLQKLFEKKMDRKEFLAHIGVSILAILGVSGLIKNLVNYQPHLHRQELGGYGSSSYGGHKRS